MRSSHIDILFFILAFFLHCFLYHSYTKWWELISMSSQKIEKALTLRFMHRQPLECEIKYCHRCFEWSSSTMWNIYCRLLFVGRIMHLFIVYWNKQLLSPYVSSAFECTTRRKDHHPCKLCENEFDCWYYSKLWMNVYRCVFSFYIFSYQFHHFSRSS